MTITVFFSCFFNVPLEWGLEIKNDNGELHRCPSFFWYRKVFNLIFLNIIKYITIVNEV